MALMGFREYARHRKVTLRAVQKAIEAGRISTVGETPNRKIDSDQADRDWRLNTDPAAQSLLYSAGVASPQAEAGMAAVPGAVTAAAPGIPDTDDEPTPADQTGAYRIERAIRERLRREREEIELEELRGNIISLADAELTVFTAFRTLRDSMLQIAARIKDRCAAAADPFMVEQIIEAEIATTFARFDPAKMVQPALDDEEEVHEAG